MDKEIIKKALKHHANSGIGYFDKNYVFQGVKHSDILNLINELEAENEELSNKHKKIEEQPKERIGMKYVEIIGPCSKYIDGKGWVTQIPEHLLFAKGYVNLLELMSENNKNSNIKLNTNERLRNVIQQDQFKCKHLECDMDGAHCSLGQTDCFDYCRLQRVPYCDKYEEKE